MYQHRKLVSIVPSNKRTQRALGRSPEDKVKGLSGAIYRGPQGHNLNNFGVGPLDNVIYQMKALGLLVADKNIFENCILITYFFLPRNHSD